VNVEYVASKVGTGPVYSYGAITSNKLLTTNWVNFATVSITTNGGGVYLFPETGIQAMGDFAPGVARTIYVEYRRNGTAIKSITNSVGNIQLNYLTVPIEYIGYVDIPDLFDQDVIGTAGSYSYTLWLKVDSTSNFVAATSFISGRLNAVEFK
jgi:hypothetical protein